MRPSCTRPREFSDSWLAPFTICGCLALAVERLLSLAPKLLDGTSVRSGDSASNPCVPPIMVSTNVFDGMSPALLAAKLPYSCRMTSTQSIPEPFCFVGLT
jgi:hypothetical protein